MIKTYSMFYYGFEVTADNQILNIKEGTGDELIAEIEVGSYSASQLMVAVKTALDSVGANTYEVEFDRDSRRVTITSTGVFTLLGEDGSHFENNAQTLLGFSQTPTSSALSHEGGSVAGDIFRPQLWLQEYIPTRDYQQAVDAKVNKTANGGVEVVKFGTEKFMECNIKLQTNIDQGTRSYLRTNLTGEDDLRRFLQFLVTKAPLEFMPDENEPDDFETLILESTPDSQDGVGYRMKEMWDVGFNDYFQTGKLKFRKIEDD